MNTENIKKIVENSWNECTSFFKSLKISPYKCDNDILAYCCLDDLLLDLYCSHNQFHRVTRSKLISYADGEENNYFKNHKLSFNKNNFYDNTRYMTADINEAKKDSFFNTYAGSFFSKSSFNLNDKNNLFTYSDYVLAIIIAKWKYMPFNPRFLYNSRKYKIEPIPPKQYEKFLSLSINPLLKQDFDKIVYHQLTDHYFNINIFCQLINFLQYTGSSKDYSIKLHSISYIFILFSSALQTLPTYSLKNYFWNKYIDVIRILIKEKNISFNGNTISDVITLTEYFLNDIYCFSLVQYPITKLLFKKYLENSFSNSNLAIENLYDWISKHSEEYLNNPTYTIPNYSFDFLYGIGGKKQLHTLNSLSREFYSVQKPTPFSKYLDKANSTPSEEVKYFFNEVTENVRNLIKKCTKIN